MKHILTLITALLLATPTALLVEEFRVQDFGAKADGTTDDTEAFQRCFAEAAKTFGASVIIPGGQYVLEGAKPIGLSSHTTVSAYGARFHLPEKLGDKARVVLFAGNNVNDFRWFGGHFRGHVFDPANETNSWEPNANTRAILITTTPEGQSENLTFRDVTSDGMAGAVITVLGATKASATYKLMPVM